MATKLCTTEGSWYVHSHTNATWTNYSQCYTSRMTKVVIRFPDLHNSSLISQYVPAVKTVSRIGYGVSLATLLIAFCIFATFKKLRCPRNKLHMHLFVSFIMRAFTSLLKDALFVRGVGLPSDLAFLQGEAYFLHDNKTTSTLYHEGSTNQLNSHPPQHTRYLRLVIFVPLHPYLEISDKSVFFYLSEPFWRDEAEVAHDFNGFFTFVACGLDPRPSELQVTQTRIQCPAVSMMFAPVLEKELTEII
ncbi:Parathyroid hormone/parathyroid hormone- peptide receptor [Homalodisca vitripennis]|nr:Parathyroid hormone/parathyroid hormone- peptide receptor [Homalodisca vitripennis]